MFNPGKREPLQQSLILDQFGCAILHRCEMLLGVSFYNNSKAEQLWSFLDVCIDGAVMQVRWFHAEEHFALGLEYARAWQGQRSVHVLDAFGNSGKIARLGEETVIKRDKKQCKAKEF